VFIRENRRDAISMFEQTVLMLNDPDFREKICQDVKDAKWREGASNPISLLELSDD
jgi:hypothetical protein